MVDVKNIMDSFQKHGLGIVQEPIRFGINNNDTSTILKNALSYFLKIKSDRDMVWKKEYEEVADWLKDNKGKGLLLYGGCGLGKTMIAKYCLPPILLKYCGKVMNVFDVSEMNKDPEFALSKGIICIDDFGTEEATNIYGNKRMVLTEIIDNAEKKGHIVVLTTNLNRKQIKEKYKERCFDRLIGITRRIEFSGESFRR